MATLKEERVAYSQMFGEDAICEEREQLDLNELEQSVADCYSMLLYSLDLNDSNEIAFWRKMYQEAKVELRNIKKQRRIAVA